MSTSQQVRYAPFNPSNFNNPSYVVSDIKPSRILVAAGAPAPTVGTLLDYYIDNATGNFYGKDESGVWNLLYNFTVAPGSGLTDLDNLGLGAQIYVPPPIAGIADLRSLVSSTGKITFVTEPNDINLGVSLDKSDVQLPLVQNILNNYSAGFDPTAINDSTQNYSVGSLWWNSSSGALFFCQDNTAGAAVWIQINISASGFLTNCANIGLIGPFAGLSGSIANFRGFVSPDNSITISQAGNDINFVAPGVFKDLASFGFTSAMVITVINTLNTFQPMHAPWDIIPASFTRPISGGWAINGGPLFFDITREMPSSSLNGTNYYEVNYAFVVSAGGPPGSTELNIRWVSSGNCMVGNTTSTLVLPTTGTKGTLAGSFIVASFDTAAFSLSVEISSTLIVVPVTVYFATCTITQI